MTEINAHGGELKTYQVEVDPDKLGTYRLSMTDVFNALKNNNANVGGGYLIHEGEAPISAGVSQARSVEDISAIVIDERERRPGDHRQRGPGPARADDPGGPSHS